jgi:hypothetical protein
VSSEPGQDLEGEAVGLLFGNPDIQPESSVGDGNDVDGLWDKDDIFPPPAEDEEEHRGSQLVHNTLLFCRSS